MLSMRTLFGPVEIIRSVDDGLVFCPVQGRDVAVDHCTSCTFLESVVQGVDDSLSEIACQIPMGALTGHDRR